MTVHAEISIIPISRLSDTSMSKEVASAFNAIRKVQGVKATLTALGTQIEAEGIEGVTKAIEAAHEAVKREGAARIISTVRIDERFDKIQSLDDKVRSVQQRLSE